MGLKTVALQGRLVKDPELRQSRTGTDITTFTVAVDSNRKPHGDEKPKSSFFRVTAFGARGKAVADHMRKGDEISVSGDIELDTYEGKDGKTYSNLSVIASDVYFGRKQQALQSGQTQTTQQPASKAEPVW